MRSCSDSIAQLAAALAKAQMELVNPAKSLTAMIDRWGIGQEGLSYRYAPLSAGLEIVRKTLCKHELAVIQTTHLDAERGLVLLTTTLAHGSGEWVAASWPVCRAADMTNPKLMGAALTYARRYGLFTLVGLAGEDDLDAPELPQLHQPNGTGETRRVLGTSGAPSPTAERAASAMQGTPDGSAISAGPESTAERPGGAGLVVAPAGDIRKRASDERASHERTRARRPDRHRRLRTALEVSAGSLDPVHELAAATDIDALIAWAARMMPVRNCMAETQRAELDAAFLARAEALGAGSELLLAFTPGREREPQRTRAKVKPAALPRQLAS